MTLPRSLIQGDPSPKHKYLFWLYTKAQYNLPFTHQALPKKATRGTEDSDQISTRRRLSKRNSHLAASATGTKKNCYTEQGCSAIQRAGIEEKDKKKVLNRSLLNVDSYQNKINKHYGP